MLAAGARGVSGGSDADNMCSTAELGIVLKTGRGGTTPGVFDTNSSATIIGNSDEIAEVAFESGGAGLDFGRRAGTDDDAAFGALLCGAEQLNASRML